MSQTVRTEKVHGKNRVTCPVCMSPSWYQQEIQVCYSNLYIASESSHYALSVNGIADYAVT